MEVFLIAAVIGVIPGWIAQSKGRSFAAWWIFGSLLFIVALPMSIAIKPDPNAPGLAKPGALLDNARAQVGSGRRCPYCAEFIREEAIVCRFCGRDLPQGAPASHTVHAAAQSGSAADPVPPPTDSLPDPTEHTDAATVAPCGHQAVAGQQFCTTCGSSFGAPVCANGHQVEQGDTFCATCGVSLVRDV